jgi:DNA-binding IclR family transcriptional regulator
VSRSLARALRLLHALEDGPRTLDELTAVDDVHKTTVLRLLRTLEDDRFVRHDEQHRYSLGSGLFALAAVALDQRDVRATARRHLERLSAETSQTVHLATLEGTEIVYVDKIDAPQGVPMASRIGLRAPVHCTAVGKVLIADLPAAARRESVASLGFERFTTRTITDTEEFERELDRAEERGFAVDHEEHESFINCVAVPVRDGTGAVVAAVSVSVPTVSLDHDGVLALLPAVRRAADAASADLGWEGGSAGPAS